MVGYGIRADKRGRGAKRGGGIRGERGGVGQEKGQKITQRA